MIRLPGCVSLRQAAAATEPAPTIRPASSSPWFRTRRARSTSWNPFRTPQRTTAVSCAAGTPCPDNPRLSSIPPRPRTKWG